VIAVFEAWEDGDDNRLIDAAQSMYLRLTQRTLP
jgi:hypothetical protein